MGKPFNQLSDEEKNRQIFWLIKEEESRGIKNKRKHSGKLRFGYGTRRRSSKVIVYGGSNKW